MLRSKIFARVLMVLTSVFSVALIAGCAGGAAKNITQPTSYGAKALAFEKAKPSAIQSVAEAGPESGSENTWGAIATIDPANIAAGQTMDENYSSYSIIGFGVANNQATQEEAEKTALAMCQADGEEGCAVRYTFKGQCFAIYSSFDEEQRAFGWAVGSDYEKTNQEAIAACEKNSDGISCLDFHITCP